MTVSVNNSENCADRDALVKEHFGLAAMLANLYLRSHPSADSADVHSAANLGLFEASRNFDPSKGVNFSRFASIRINGAILDAGRDADWARRSLRRRIKEVARSQEQLQQELMREPSVAELAIKMQCDEATIRELLTAKHETLALHLESLLVDPEFLITTDSDSGGEEHVIAVEDAAIVTKCFRVALEELPENLREVFIAYYSEGRLMAEIGEEFGVSEARVSQMRREACELIREAFLTLLSIATDNGDDSSKMSSYTRQRDYCQRVYRRLRGLDVTVLHTHIPQQARRELALSLPTPAASLEDPLVSFQHACLKHNIKPSADIGELERHLRRSHDLRFGRTENGPRYRRGAVMEAARQCLTDRHGMVDSMVLPKEAGPAPPPPEGQHLGRWERVAAYARQHGLVTGHQAAIELQLVPSAKANPAAHMTRLERYGLQAVDEFGGTRLYRLEDVRQAEERKNNCRRAPGTVTRRGTVTPPPSATAEGEAEPAAQDITPDSSSVVNGDAAGASSEEVILAESAPPVGQAVRLALEMARRSPTFRELPDDTAEAIVLELVRTTPN